MSFQRTVLLLLLFTGSVFAQESPAESEKPRPSPIKPGPEAGIETDFPTPYFLAPLAASPSQLGLSSPREMVFLFTAPLLNRNRIEAAARRQEKYSESVLRQRQTRVVRRICGLPPTRAEERLTRLRAEQARQYRLWQSTRNRFEGMQQARITKLVAVYQQAEVQELRATVRRLITERQELVARAWKEFFDELEDDLGDCEKPRAYEQVPDEHLHLPVFLARYYFFRKLPPRLRIKFTP